MKIMPSQSELRTLLDYDEKTGFLTWKHRPQGPKSWNVRFAGKRAFTNINPTGYYKGAINYQTYLASRIIFKWLYDEEPDIVDHINGDTLNNSKNNLRSLTPQENSMNTRRTRKTGTGVSWDKTNQKWKATIGVNGRTKTLGSFTDKEMALRCRRRAEKEFGYVYHTKA